MKNHQRIEWTPSRRRYSGFTLIEMLLVLVILGILAGIVVPHYAPHPGRARLVGATTQIANFKTAISMFSMDNGFFPRGREGLKELVTAPGDAANWKGPYMEEIPLDPWGRAYVYECPGRHNAASFDIASAGPDGVFGTDDDVTNWKK